MRKLSRRTIVLATGAAIVMSEAISGSPNADASILIKTKDDLELCTKHGGSPNEKKDYCSGTYFDKVCQLKFGSDQFYLGDERKDFDYKECDEADCFLTTACVHHVGLEDNCFELQTLRKFRDKALTRLVNGPEDIASYYELAPELVTRVLASRHASRELSRAYFLYILPCVVLAKMGLHKAAHRRYRNAMLDLAARLPRI